MVRIVLSLAIILAGASSAAARDIFVNNLTGNDLSDGSNPEALGGIVGPVRTIAKALRLSRKGDHVVLANTGEAYRESVTLQAGPHSGWPGSPFVFQGNGATLDGSAPVPDYAWDHAIEDIFRFQPEHVAYHQLFRNGLPLDQVHATDHLTLPALEPLQWCLFDQHVYFRTEPGRLPESYALAHSEHRVGMTLYQVQHVVVSDLTVQGFQLDGINCHSNVRDGTLVGITARGNGRSGVSIGGASRVVLAASLVGNNGAAQLRVEGEARVETINNHLLDNTAPPIVNEGAIVISRDAPVPAAVPAGEAAPPAEAPPPTAEPANPFSF